jgi:hypothetical protein
VTGVWSAVTPRSYQDRFVRKANVAGRLLTDAVRSWSSAAANVVGNLLDNFSAECFCDALVGPQLHHILTLDVVAQPRTLIAR